MGGVAELVVISGPPGSGKSTVSKRLAQAFERSVLVKGDEFFGFLAAGAILPWLPGAEPQNLVVQRAAALATGQFVRDGYDTVYDGVIGAWHLQQFLAASNVRSFHYAVLLPAAAVCEERVATRKDHGFKDIAATRRLHGQFADADIDPRHVLVDPPRQIDGVVRLIQERMTDGSLVYS